MKKLLPLTVLLLNHSFCTAQVVGADVYMHGNYVEVAVNGHGGFEGVNIDTSAVPSGFHWRSNTQYFGFVANPQKDLWVNYDGDFYTPGTPENGWGLEIHDTTSTDTFNIQLTNNRSDMYGDPVIDIPGYYTGFTHSGGITTVNWHGDYVNGTYDLDVDILYTLGDTDLYYTTNVTVFNNGPANIEDLYYYRNIDPDNNMITSGSFVTTNTIVSQGSSTSPMAVVKAEQSSPWLSTFAFFANDTSARVTYGGYNNRDGSAIWTGAGVTLGAGTATADEAVSLAFHQPGLQSFTRSGSSTVTFTYQTVFSASALAYLMSGGAITGTNNPDNAQINIYPNPASDFVNIYAKENLNSIRMYNTQGAIVYNLANVNMQTYQVNISGFEKGIYVLIIENKNGKTVKRIVKQ